LAVHLGHFGGSLCFKNLMPGVWSSPLLLLASVWLFLSARRAGCVATGNLPRAI